MGNAEVLGCSVTPGRSREWGLMEKALDVGHVFSLCKSLLGAVVLSCAAVRCWCAWSQKHDLLEFQDFVVLWWEGKEERERTGEKEEGKVEERGRANCRGRRSQVCAGAGRGLGVWKERVRRQGRRPGRPGPWWAPPAAPCVLLKPWDSLLFLFLTVLWTLINHYL